MLPDKPAGPEGDKKKSSKPVMEKKRRARINASLVELKSLQLEMIKKEGTRHSKMEKADILELTVRHLRQLQKQQLPGPVSPESSRTNRYKLGFSDCVSEMHRFLSVNQDIDSSVKARLLEHLTNIASSTSEPQNRHQQSIKSPPQLTNQHLRPDHMISVIPYPSSYPMTVNYLNSNGPITSGTPVLQSSSSQSTVICEPVIHSPSSNVSSSTDSQTVNSLQLLSARLSNGEMAFVLPASASVLSGSNIPSYVIPVFTTSDVFPNPIPGAQSQNPIPGAQPQNPIPGAQPQNPIPGQAQNPIPGPQPQVPFTTIHPSACLPQGIFVQEAPSGLTIQGPSTMFCASSKYTLSPGVKFNQASQTGTGLSSIIPATEPDSTRPESDSNLPNFTEHSRKVIPEAAPPVGRSRLQRPINDLTGDNMWRPW